MSLLETKSMIAELENEEKSLSKEIYSHQQSYIKYENALSVNKTAIKFLENFETPPEIVVSESIRKMLYE